MVRKSLVFVFVISGLLLCLGLSDGADGAAAPRVISTNPKTGTVNVPPSLDMITVTFSKPMQDKSWSWSYEDKEMFPRMTGQPYYKDGGTTTCVLPVKLEPNKQYVIWINTARYKNFKDKSGTPAEPYKLTFSTGAR